MTTLRKLRSRRGSEVRMGVYPYSVRAAGYIISKKTRVLFYMNYGKERKEEILKLFHEDEYIKEYGIRINRKGCVILNKDKDLQHLVEKGTLIRKRLGSRNSKSTFLVLA